MHEGIDSGDGMHLRGACEGVDGIDRKALEVELDTEARLDAADARAAAIYKAGVWGKLRGMQYVGVP